MTAGLALLLGALLPLQAQHDAHGGKAEKSGKAGGHASAPQAPRDTAKKRHEAAAPRGEPRAAHEPSQRPAASPRKSPQARPERQPARHHEASPGPSRASRDWQRNKGWRKGDGWKGTKNWKGSRAQHWDHEHRTWAQRGGYGGTRMPQVRYDRYFGPDHFFRMRGRPVLYGGYPRFSYGGTTFLIVDPWPEYWPERWYADDDMYVAWDDGYYLYNRRSPGVGISISINL